MAQLPFFVVPTALGTITAGNELTSNPASHLNEFDAVGMTWETSNNTNVFVRGNFGASREVNFCGMLAANAIAATTLRLRLGATQTAVDGTAAYDSGALPFINPSITRPDGLYHSHLEIGTLQSQPWWRIDIGSHTGFFEAAMLVLGKKLTPGNFYSDGFGFGVDDLAKAEVNRFGLIERQAGIKLRTISFTLGWMLESEFEATWRPFFEAVGSSTPIFLCFDPTANTYRQARTYFGLLNEIPFSRQTRVTAAGPRFEATFEMQSML